MSFTYPLTLPALPGIAKVSLSMKNLTAQTISPFSGAQQVYQNTGRWWEADLSIPIMLRAQAEPWLAFLAQLKGRRGTFLLGDPAAASPQGAVSGSPTVSGAHAVGAEELAVAGLPINTGDVFKAGDYIQLGAGGSAKLHKVLISVSTGPGGTATLDIFPPLRSAYAGGEAVAYTSCKGNFRLASDEPGWETDERGFYTVAFDAREAI